MLSKNIFLLAPISLASSMVHGKEKRSWGGEGGESLLDSKPGVRRGPAATTGWTGAISAGPCLVGSGKGGKEGGKILSLQTFA